MVVEIKPNESLSSVINLGSDYIVNFLLPSNWSASSMTFQVGKSEVGPFYNVYDNLGSELSVVAGASRYIVGNMKLAGVKFMKIRSGTAASPVPVATKISIDVDQG